MKLHNRNNKRIKPASLVMSCLLAVIVFVSCADNEPTGEVVDTHWTTYKVAVVMPSSESEAYNVRFKRIAEWFQNNSYKAQTLFDEGIKLQLEWYDETTEDIESLANKLVSRDDISLIIGPAHSANVDIMASACAKTYKPMIVPVASSEEIIRKYASSEAGTSVKSSFLWSLTETDISQSEVMLSKIASIGKKSIVMVSSDDTYGKTFYEWVPFIANELGLELKQSLQYTDEASLVSATRAAMSEDADYCICVVGNVADAKTIISTRAEIGDDAPKIMFSDGAMSPELLEMGDNAEGVEGVAMYADPTSGFQISYEELYGETPAAIEAQLYDALLLSEYALAYCKYSGETDINEAIKTITSQDSHNTLNAWDKAGITGYLTSMFNADYLMKLKGACGVIKFDDEAYTSVVQSTYAHWMVYGEQIVALDFASSDGSKRQTSTLASWYWKAQEMQTFSDENTWVTYGNLNDQYAVLVAGSQSWYNYRHQADVLNMYQLLKTNGFDDDHIILIMKDDIAYNTKNTYQGVIRTSVDGENLYTDVKLDYCIDSITVDDISNILLGVSSVHLPVVLNTDINSNILFYWSGHGTQGQFVWKSESTGFTTDMLSETLQNMYNAQKYRKMLICAEPCFSSSVVKAAEGIPGVLAFASANENESSFADNYSIELGTWLSDRFSNNLSSSVASNPNVSYRTLYTYLVSHTLGSHVRVYNASLFDNLYNATPYEFFVYSK